MIAEKCEYVFDWDWYSANEMSSLVCDAIITIVGNHANLHGMGWSEVEHALLEVFSEYVDVVEDEEMQQTRVWSKRDESGVS